MVTMEHRLGQLGGAYEHLATKSDLADLRTEVRAGMSELQADIARSESRLIRWMATIMIGGMATAAGFALAVDRLVGS